MGGFSRDAESERRALVSILQGAYSGELAACYAYQGHAAAVDDPDEVWQIRAIEAEEWEHRARVGEILEALGSGPRPGLDRKMALVGKTIGLLCRVGGWLLPMYGAGRLERGNIVEYEDAARHAFACGRSEFVDDLLHMAEVEWEHEQYFRGRVGSHTLAHLLPIWDAPASRDAIRASFERDCGVTRSRTTRPGGPAEMPQASSASRPPSRTERS